MKALGLDIGTTSISAVIFQEKTGVLETKTIAGGTFLPSESWERLQDPIAIWQKTSALAETLLQRHPDVQAIGVTGQMHGIVYLDANGEAVSPLFTWQDGRGDLPFDETGSWAEHLSAISGYPLSTGYGMGTHFYNLHHGLVPENAVCLCTIGDYIAMKLAGLTRPRIEPTNGASLGLFDLGNRCFDPEALLHSEMDEAILPEIAQTPLLGIGALGIPVYAAIGDNQAAFLGAVGDRQDALLVNVGTGSQVAVYSPQLLRVPGLETRPFPDGGWLLVGASLCGGRSYALLENFFRQTVKMVTGSEQSAYAAMDKALRESVNVEDVPCTTTTFQGTRQNANLRGSICGIGVDNFTPVHLMHSFMNGMAQELYGMYRSFLDAGGVAPKTIIGSGNGLRKNVHLCRYRYRGQLYHMPIHGFAPTAEFSVTEHTDSAASFVLESCPRFYEQYPFLFRYCIRYHLEETTLRVEITVENKDEKTMYFGLGGHPGIHVPLEEGLRFEDYVLEVPPCQPWRVEFTPACFITGRELPFPLEGNRLPLAHHMFDEDAIVLKGIPGEVTLKSPKGHRGVTLMAPDFPVFGFWHMPRTDAPYICLEPWSSLPSHQDVIEDLEKQADLISLPAMEVYHTAWSLQCF